MNLALLILRRKDIYGEKLGKIKTKIKTLNGTET